MDCGFLKSLLYTITHLYDSSQSEKKHESCEKKTIDALAEELVEMCISFLKIEEKKSAALVCKQWNRLAINASKIRALSGLKIIKKISIESIKSPHSLKKILDFELEFADVRRKINHSKNLGSIQNYLSKTMHEFIKRAVAENVGMPQIIDIVLANFEQNIAIKSIAYVLRDKDDVAWTYLKNQFSYEPGNKEIFEVIERVAVIYKWQDKTKEEMVKARQSKEQYMKHLNSLAKQYNKHECDYHSIPCSLICIEKVFIRWEQASLKRNIRVLNIRSKELVKRLENQEKELGEQVAGYADGIKVQTSESSSTIS